jgi:acyl-CoA synthetase (AMP-forming)/AMP-acid ligase II
MFTSGTTGMPKAARVTNRRWAVAALGAAAGCQLTSRDTVYCALPLYHATGLLIGCGGALVGGARLALAPKFSTSTFWNDVHRYGASVVIYVGELCRYLVNAPPTPIERSHAVRVFAGNGMRKDVWERVLERFGDVRVLEFYGSTEGNVALVNLSGRKVGSVGRPFVEETNIELAEYDAATGDIVRDEDGYGVVAETNEPGLLLSRVANAHPLARFDGYADEEATERKLLRDVFEKGDAWFNTGDVLRKDEDGDYWFIDRVGDTFRWKGENVSTEQVSQVIQTMPSIDFCSVYGVELEGHEGKAGMAAIQLKDGATFDTELASKLVNENLFPAARPLFIRVVEHLPVTNTLKLTKVQLEKEGANPRNISDALYFYNQDAEQYEPLGPDEYDSLLE